MHPTTSSAPSTRDTLARVPFLEELPAGVLDRLVTRVVERSASKGAVLFREHEPCTGFWIVASGSANIVKLAPDGRVQILETCPVGTIFGLVSAIDGGGYPATVEAREASRFIVFPSPVLKDLVLERPEVGLGIARHFATRLRRTTCRAASVCLRSVRSRVATHLIEALAEAGHDPRTGSGVVALGGSQEELAQRLGTVREVLARTLRSFRDENLIAQRGDSVTVLDIEKLEKVAAS